MGTNRLLLSVVIGWAIALPAVVLVYGAARPSPLAERMSVLLAMPLTVVWFGVPALLACFLWIMPLASLMRRVGQQTSAPLVLSVAGVALSMAFIHARQGEEYGMAVAIAFAASVVAWACYAVVRPPWDDDATTGLS